MYTKEEILNPSNQEFIDWLKMNYNIIVKESSEEYKYLRDKFNEIFLDDLELADQANREKRGYKYE